MSTNDSISQHLIGNGDLDQMNSESDGTDIKEIK